MGAAEDVRQRAATVRGLEALVGPAAAAAAELLQQSREALANAQQRLIDARPVQVRIVSLGRRLERAQGRCEAAERELVARQEREVAAAQAREQAAREVEEQREAVEEARRQVETMRAEQAQLVQQAGVEAEAVQKPMLQRVQSLLAADPGDPVAAALMPHVLQVAAAWTAGREPIPLGPEPTLGGGAPRRTATRSRSPHGDADHGEGEEGRRPAPREREVGRQASLGEAFTRGRKGPEGEGAGTVAGGTDGVADAALQAAGRPPGAAGAANQ